MVTEFEIHVAAEAGHVPEEFAQALEREGFRDDRLLELGIRLPSEDSPEGSSCPLIGLHVTWDTYDLDSYRAKRRMLDGLLRQYRDSCTGYMHAEVIRPEWDQDIKFHEFDEFVRLPIRRLDAAVRPQAKLWDIHVSADVACLDPRLQERLREVGFYSIELAKQGQERSRVFTIQGVNHYRDGKRLFHAMWTYLRAAGGMRGSIKYEQTVKFEAFGSVRIVPPTIEAIEFAA